ncbi:MAG TPA: SMP-30/gluconolactonase/LRE family protein [Chitinophagales bacterium]|nr:SMP-30/gluconolactonase/LRE family protein [Chitinophagales bacterium]
MFKKILFFCVILSSILSCKKEKIRKTYTKIITAPGPEDIVLDKVNNRMLVSCDERRDGFPARGEIQQISLLSDTSIGLPLINLPAIPFHPHGFDLQNVNGVDYLYVINHYRDVANTNSVLQFEIRPESLMFIKEFKHPLLISPNDLTVLPNGSFYFSNDRNSPDITELLTNPKAGSVVFCDGNTSWKKVDSAIAFPNGLYQENNKLYLATSRNFALFTYDIQPDGSLRNRKTLSSINGMDNLISNGDELIVAVHPDEVKFALLSYLPNELSPCKTFLINKTTGAANIIFSDDGSLISGSSTAIVSGKDLYLSQVFDGFVLKIANYAD